MDLAESTVDISAIRDLVRKGNTHKQISDILKEIYPGKTGFRWKEAYIVCAQSMESEN